MDIPRFRFDYSFVDLDELGRQCITTDEIESVFYTTLNRIFDYTRFEGFGHCIGYSYKNKFISFIFELRDDDVRVTSIWLSYEQEILNRYFLS